MKSIQLIALLFLFQTCTNDDSTPIDRFSLVSRHTITLTRPDTLASLSVGNGEFAFTVDATGLQTFPDDYERGISLGTQAQWAWHSTSNIHTYELDEVYAQYASCTDSVPYAIQHAEGRKGEATEWLRSNPHRLHLGLIGLKMETSDGHPTKLTDIQNLNQSLNLWRGEIRSDYEIEGTPVSVSTVAHPDKDQLSATIESPLLQSGKMKIQFRFPYGKECHTCAGYDFESPDRHSTVVVRSDATSVTLMRQLDSTRYWVRIRWSKGTFVPEEAHTFTLSTTDSNLAVSVQFSKVDDPSPDDYVTTRERSRSFWESFWKSGGAIDFSACTDPRAKELERRVILSQYLTRIQCAGSLPPQETGLTFNSWFGKFHLEMHWWHATHFPLWSRPELLEKSMPYYRDIMDKAQATAQLQGYSGARWPKMTDPNGNESPSSVGAFLAWQQPHVIYFSELLCRQDTSALHRYKDLVAATADFMASYVTYDSVDHRYHLCHPLIPAQEIFKATDTNDPPFELAYWKYGLTIAQEWRKRLGLEPDKKWQDIINRLTPLPMARDRYLPVAGAVDAYLDDWFRRDHPVVTGVYGVLPGNGMADPRIMALTFDDIMNRWDWPTTWGWDYPMLAMCAARLGKPEKAIDALLLDVEKNTYLVNGHNYQDQRLRLYLPGNGGLLAAVAMMARGWDGSEGDAPGFPKNGNWNIRHEGLARMP